jgi:6-phosphogluconolactonase
MDNTSSNRSVIVLPELDDVAEAAAQRLVGLLLSRQSARRPAHIALTGGTAGIAVLQHVRSNPLLGSLHWRDVHLWWGDERFLAPGDPERNETGARGALLNHIPIRPAQVHPMPPLSAQTPTAETAASRYAVDLAVAAGGYPAPLFDVVMLGIGPDAHVASLFPGFEAQLNSTLSVVAVHNSPKPPPDRVSLTLPTLNHARETWFVASGAGKADAVARALSGDPTAPASLIQAERSVTWFLDSAAASGRELTT